MNDFETAKQHFLGGLQLLEKNDFRAAENEFKRSLELLPDRVSTLNNLASVKIKLKQFAEAEKLARRAIALENISTDAWTNLAVALAGTERAEEALRAADQALQHDSFNAKAWLVKATILLNLKQFDRVIIACDQFLKIQPGTYDLLYIKSQALKELGQMDEAQKVYMQSFEARVAVSPAVVAERRSTQKAEVLILNPTPIFNEKLRPFERLQVHCPNFPGQFVKHLTDDIHFSYIFVGDAARESSRAQIPRPDVLLNNCSNAEVVASEDNVDAMSKLVDTFQVPVINHPQKVAQSRRDVEVKLLEGTPGVIVPKTTRFTLTGKSHEAVISEIEAEFTYPLITRSLTKQRGRGMNLAESREQLTTILATDIEENFFISQFYDTRGGSPYYRKLRAAIVDKDILVMRVDFSPKWKVHGRQTPERAKFYLDNPHLLEMEERTCQDPEAELGTPVWQALQAIRARIPMDVFGLDFDADTQGRVIFYEANATMNLFHTAHPSVLNPKFAEDRLKAAFVRYFTSFAKRH